MAYEAGDIFVKAGAISVRADNSQDSPVEISENTQFGITGTYMFHSKWGVELLAATPFEHNIKVPETDIGDVDATTKHLPPTVSLQFYPLSGENSRIQPYLGLGVNYTTFFSDEEKTTGTDIKLKLKDSWGLAYSAGVNIHLTDNVLLNAAVWKMDISTKINNKELDVAGVYGARVDIDPTVFLVGVGYKF